MSTTRGVEFVLNIRGNAKEKADAISASAVRAERALKGMDSATMGAVKGLTGIREAAEKMQLGGLNRALGVMQSGLLGLASPATGAALAVGALATASVAATAGVVKLVAASSRWLAELDEAGRSHGLVTDRQREDIVGASAAMVELGIELKRVGVIVAADFAPYVRDAVTAIADLVEASEGLAKSTDWARLFLTVMGGQQVRDAISLWTTLRDRIRDVTSDTRGASGGFAGGPREATSGSQGFGFRAAWEQGGLQSPSSLKNWIPKGGGKGKEDRVKVDLGDEWEADAADDARTRAALREQARAILEAQADWDRMAQAMTTTAANTASMSATLNGAKFGAAFGLLKGILEVVVNLGSTLRGAFDYVLGSVEGLGRTFENLFTQVVPRLIERLPNLIGAVLNLPFAIMRGIINAIPALGNALANVFLRAIQKLLEFFRGGEDKNILTGEKEKWLGTSFKRGEFSLFGFFNNDDWGDDDRERNRIRRRQDRGREMNDGRRSRMTGGYIERTGRYMLHAGERVVPPTGASTSAALAAMRGGGGGARPVQVTIGTAIGMDARELARWISRYLGNYGTGAALAARV